MNAIPTMYNGLQMRSRLEARWAAFFDTVGWPWHYEPFDLQGYIPDFVLLLHKPILVEVKPASTIVNHRLVFDVDEDPRSKIEESGWEHEALIVGNYPMEHSGQWMLGESYEPEWCWSLAPMMRCRNCKKLSFHSACGSFGCRVHRSGCGDEDLGDPALSDIWTAWAIASNQTRWRR